MSAAIINTGAARNSCSTKPPLSLRSTTDYVVCRAMYPFPGQPVELAPYAGHDEDVGGGRPRWRSKGSRWSWADFLGARELRCRAETPSDRERRPPAATFPAAALAGLLGRGRTNYSGGGGSANKASLVACRCRQCVRAMDSMDGAGMATAF
ncbi:hypothetical protein ON010_g17676 [Phytophthora cinnamomi]|nr:hypothetical protein ON010_g17676 [Phytophthora cinnamomi]